MNPQANSDPVEDRYIEAVVEFVRICRADDRISDEANRHWRQRLVGQALADVARRYELDKTKLGQLAGGMIARSHGRIQETTIPRKLREPTEPGKYAGDVFFGDAADPTRGTHLWRNGYEGWVTSDMLHRDADFDETSARMGYDNMVRATTRAVNEVRYEFGIVDFRNSSYAVPGKPWAVVVHQDCDADKPDQGVSSRNDFATFDEALVDFNEEIQNLEIAPQNKP